MLLARILSIISPILVTALVSILFWHESSFYYILGGSCLLISASIWLFIKVSKKVKHPREMFFYIIIGILVNTGLLMVLILLENLWFKLGIVVLLFLVLLFYFEILFGRFFKTSILEKGQEILNYKFFEIIILFFISTSLFGFIDFLNYSKFLLIATVFAIVLLLSRMNEFFSTYDQVKKSFYFHLLIALIASEIFWAVISLSFVYYLKGIRKI